MILGNRLLHTTCSARETEKIGKILKMQPGLEFFQLPCRTKLIYCIGILHLLLEEVMY